MSNREPMSGTHDCGGDAAAYALGALEPQEAEAFRAHMQECAICRDEVEALGVVVRALPLGAHQYEAPHSLRRRVMQQVPRPRRERQARSRVLAAVGAAMVAVGGAVTAIELTAGTAATVITARVSGIAGSAQVRLSDGRGELVVHHLTPPGPGHVYEVWLQSGNAAPVPASVLFGVNAAGDADVGIPGRLRGVRAVLVTPEPYGGSPKPTHKPVIVASLD